jgi:hypothetical protein
LENRNVETPPGALGFTKAKRLIKTPSTSGFWLSPPDKETPLVRRQIRNVENLP